MVSVERSILNCLFLMLVAMNVGCNTATFRSHFFEFNDIKDDIVSLSRINISDVIGEFTSHNGWMTNRDCLIELNAIKNGLENYEEWALKFVDAWGKFPSAIMHGNYFDFGSFSQCFRIQRNGIEYRTKYCIGQLKFYPDEQTPRSKVWPRLDVGPGISIGLCLPLACSINHLQRIANNVLQAKVGNMTVKIPENTCQIEESASNLNSVDFAAIGLLGFVMLLMVISTGYDMFCNANNRTKFQQLLVAFSINTNGRELFSCKDSSTSNQIQCLHGIRVISTVWLVVGHVASMVGLLPVRNRAEIIEFIGTYRSTVAYTLWLAVENFFVLSGLLASYHMFTILKKNGQLNIVSIYLQRYLRLTPLLVASFLLSMTLVRFLGSGPVWPITLAFLNGGRGQYWWSALFYTQNYVNPSEIVLINTWHLSADMQLYLVAPFLVYFVRRFKAKAFIGILALILGGIWNIIDLHVKHNLTDLGEGMKIEITYFPTHTRFISWLIGFIVGYILVEFPKGSIGIPTKLNWLAMSVSLLAMPLIILAYHPFQQPNSTSTPLEHGLYEALIGRVLWPAALCYIIFACVHSSGGLGNWFLSHPRWQPFSRVSYAMNLLNYAVIVITIGSMKAVPHPTELSVALSIVENSILAFLAAVIGTLAFEMPCKNMITLITGRNKIRFDHEEKTN